MKNVLLALLLAVTLLVPLDSYARTYSASFDKASPEKVIAALKQETGLDFVYQKDVLRYAKQPVTCDYSGLTLEQLLNRVLSVKMMLGYEVVDKTVVLKMPNVNVDVVTGEIKGVVYDEEEGEPLAGATVMIDGTTNVVVTDIDGRFTFKNVKALNPMVSVVFVGMKSQTVKVTPKNQHDLRFDMQTHATMMSEVVVTGYGDVKKEKMTGATATISAEKLDERYTLNILDNLEGRVAGLSTYGGKPVIRGLGTFRGNSAPLLVVDGLPIEGSMDNINPSNIESINVLKDAAAAAIYGARASNGIIVITTKNAHTQGKIDVDFSANVSWWEKTNVDYADNFYMTPEQQVNAESDYYEYYFFNNDGEVKNPVSTVGSQIKTGTSVTPVKYAYYQLANGEITRDQLEARLDGFRRNNYARDYADAMLHRQIVQQYNLALRKSTDNTRSNLVINYKHDTQTMRNSKNDWLNVSWKGSYDFGKWLTANVMIDGLYTHNRGYSYSYGGASTPWAYTSYMPFYNEDGSVRKQYPYGFGSEYWTPQAGCDDLGVNPMKEILDNVSTTRVQNMRYHADLLFKIIPGLTANAQFVYETGTSQAESKANEESLQARVYKNAYAYVEDDKVKYKIPEGGVLKTTTTNTNSWTARGQLNYSKTFLEHHDIAVIAGLEFRETLSKGHKSLLLGYNDQLQTSANHAVDFDALKDIVNSKYFMPGKFMASNYGYSDMKSSMGLIKEIRHRYASGYFNGTYTYKERYNIFGSFRKDYADVYGLNSKFRGKPLWSVGVGWNVHNESFMENYTWVNFLKLRFSYGVTGNIYQGATSYMTAITGETASLTHLPIASIESPANPDLRWEQTKSTNAGIDFALFGHRLRGSFDYYVKNGNDIFHTLPLELTSGFRSIVANAASIKNQGVELAIGYDWFRPGRRNDFGWTTNVTFTYNKNEVTKVNAPITSAWEQVETPYKVGYPVKAMWSYKFAGISSEKGTEGQNLYYKADGTTSTSITDPESLVYSGQSDPKTIVSLQNSLRWKGFNLNVNMVYYGGHKMYALPQVESRIESLNSPLASYFLNAWTPENPTNTPGIGRYAADRPGSEAENATNAVHDASFIKIRNIVVGYDFPKSWLRHAGINHCALRFQIDNPKAIWTANNIGVDPETLGVRTRSSYMLGLNLNL